MPAESTAQLGFAAMSKSAAGRKKLRAHGKKPMPQKVASEMVHATKGHKLKKGHVAKK